MVCVVDIISLALLLLALLAPTCSVDIISTIAGTGTGTYSGDGSSATSAALNKPTGVIVDTSGMHKWNFLFIPIYLIMNFYDSNYNHPFNC